MILEPYEHDCTKCQWVGWYSPRSLRPKNVYVCGLPEDCEPSIVIREGNEGSDYWSLRAWRSGKPAPIEVPEQVRQEKVWGYIEELTEGDFNQAWVEGFICGLATAGYITEEEEDALLRQASEKGGTK